VILSHWGDSYLMPNLQRMAARRGESLPFGREPSGYVSGRRGRSYFTYGKILFIASSYTFKGRWHLDSQNSFIIKECGLEGLIELARIAKIPVQRMARASTGTCISAMEVERAIEGGYLIPLRKSQVEDFKTADELLLIDKGGLTYRPVPGFYEEVAELDFASMYPTIMVEHNVSPETVNCRCCHNEKVPELGYTICEKRTGIVPATLRAVVEKRAYYKKRKRELKGKNDALARSYDRRQNALKWMLVSCFGYLGYKNARFGRIEAHESVNAFSRDAILTAKEIAENRGYELLHAIIDCMWLKKPGAAEADYEKLCKEITQRVNIDISLEGIYSWILFPASKQDPAITTANRYVGWYKHGEIKIRGIEARRHDTPKFIKQMQALMLERMSKARNVKEVEALVPDVLSIASDFVSTLRSGKANPMELVLRRNITKEPKEYTNNSISAVVSKLVEEMGVKLSAGESIQFIIIDQSGKKKPEKAKPLALYAFEDGYDVEQYTEFTLKAIETLLSPFGYDLETLKKLLAVTLPKKSRRRLTTAVAEEKGANHNVNMFHL